MRLPVAVVIFMCLLLAGCAGYRPLYARNDAGGSAADALASVSVEQQFSRTGQLLRNELLSTLARSASPKYGLRLALTERYVDVATMTNQTLTRRRFMLNAHYELVDPSGKVVTSGNSFSNSSFDAVNQPVADAQAAESARARAAHEVGQDIKLRLAAFFATGVK